ncbi:unnamed protein product, partial [Soboliphyme baturini]|uniref:Peptidase_S9 domain-containing protein n=1 Tax=Soboliphyme baturini TaxID=241478 RepID=A0A183J9C1_9BILA
MDTDIPKAGFDSLPSTSRILSDIQLTFGEWEVFVDEAKTLIYFLGYRDSPLEKPPKIFNFVGRSSGFLHYCYVFTPDNCEETLKYPTVLYVYGGPEVQLVKNVWTGYEHLCLTNIASNMWWQFDFCTTVLTYRSMCVQKLTSLGYVVIIIDGRGSAHRGIKFESVLKQKMGVVEIEDQMEGLFAIAEEYKIIDLERVAIYGWSYGGYLSLMAICQNPEVFKVSFGWVVFHYLFGQVMSRSFKIAISGAPVVNWNLYDTAYTERYLGLPQENSAVYVESSLLSRVDDFPSEAGRVLIIHGLLDENVHFKHTSTLVEALVNAGKPHQLQIIPNEGHAFRSAASLQYMDALIIDFL